MCVSQPSQIAPAIYYIVVAITVVDVIFCPFSTQHTTLFSAVLLLVHKMHTRFTLNAVIVVCC